MRNYDGAGSVSEVRRPGQTSDSLSLYLSHTTRAYKYTDRQAKTHTHTILDCWVVGVPLDLEMGLQGTWDAGNSGGNVGR